MAVTETTAAATSQPPLETLNKGPLLERARQLQAALDTRKEGRRDWKRIGVVLLTIALGVAIPALSVTLAHIAGSLAVACWWLAIGMGLIALTVLAVSLSHLTEAIADLTGCCQWQAKALAVTLDLSIVGCELVGVFAKQADLDGCRYAVMFVVMGFSMVLNCYAFLKHQAAK